MSSRQSAVLTPAVGTSLVNSISLNGFQGANLEGRLSPVAISVKPNTRPGPRKICTCISSFALLHEDSRGVILEMHGEARIGADLTDELSAWQRWLQHPERSRLRNALFQIHFWMGAVTGIYLALMSLTGSIIVHRNELSGWVFVERLVDLHANLMFGKYGRAVNGAGAICLTLLCFTGAIIWWPGLRYWRRSLTVSWRANFPRITWDLHSALGFWSLLLILLWGVSAIYFAFPRIFDGLFLLDPADRFTDVGLSWLGKLHFGRFNWFTEAVWTVLGLAPAILAFTGMFICCRRVIYKKPSNPNT